MCICNAILIIRSSELCHLRFNLSRTRVKKKKLWGTIYRTHYKKDLSLSSSLIFLGRHSSAFKLFKTVVARKGKQPVPSAFLIERWSNAALRDCDGNEWIDDRTYSAGWWIWLAAVRLVARASMLAAAAVRTMSSLHCLCRSRSSLSASSILFHSSTRALLPGASCASKLRVILRRFANLCSRLLSSCSLPLPSEIPLSERDPPSCVRLLAEVAANFTAQCTSSVVVSFITASLWNTNNHGWLTIVVPRIHITYRGGRYSRKIIRSLLMINLMQALTSAVSN